MSLFFQLSPAVKYQQKVRLGRTRCTCFTHGFNRDAKNDGVTTVRRLQSAGGMPDTMSPYSEPTTRNIFT